MASSLALQCLVLNDYSSQVFKIIIEGDESVDTLKQRIKESHLPDVPIRHIHICSIVAPIPIEADIDSNAEFGLAVLQACSRDRRGSQKLSEAFSGDLDDRNLHVVVDVDNYVPTTVTLLCTVRAANTDIRNVFTITIDRRATVAELGMAIEKTLLGSHGPIPHGSLKIRKVSMMVDDSFEERVKEVCSRQEVLPPPSPLLVCFPLKPVPLHVHVIAEAPKVETQVLSPSKHPLQLVSGQRDRFAKDNPPGPPSYLGVAKVFFDRQKKEQHQILCGRPWDAVSVIPVELLHPVFGEFVDDCQICEVTEVDDENVLELRELMSRYYDTEELRANSIRQELLDAWGLPFLKTKIGDFESNGDISIDGFRYAIAEFKNELSLEGAEPYLQATLYYLEATRDIASRFPNSVLPCFIVLVFGPCLCVAGAGWTVKPITQVLSTALPFHCHYTDVQMQTNITRHMHALKKGIQSLRKYYEGLRSTSPKDHCQCFPYPTQFQDLRSGAQRTFEYTAQISEFTLVFSAVTTDSSKEIIVKFTRTYSKEVHLFCAGRKYAPALLGFQRLPGGWFMVVMESLRDQYVNLVGRNDVPPELYGHIQKRPTELHRHGFVHGDLRKGNTMVLKADKASFMLLDFDWSGTIGEVKYPPGVNKVDIKRPGTTHQGRA